MPVRLRITLLFVGLVIFILGIVCGGIYYFSYQARINNIKIRLTNRCLTTGKLLSQREIFHGQIIQRIDSLTTLATKNKSVQVFNYQNEPIYTYSEFTGDTIVVDEKILDDARVKQSVFFTIGEKEALAYHYTNAYARLIVVSAGEDRDGKENLRMLLKILLLSFAAGNAIILVTAYIFSSRLLKPVKKIASDVEEISAHNLARRIETGDTKDEWFQLADTLNQLLNRLQESFELQQRFISNASHELSTPLTSIYSQLEVAFQRDRTAAEYRLVMQSIFQDVSQMNKLTRTLLEFAKAAGNPGGLEIKLMRIDEIILRLPAEIVKTNPGYSVLMDFGHLPETEESLLVLGNEDLLFTAMKNIVINACKYSDNQQARVLLEIDEPEIMITISDTGKGIPAEELKNIFQPFYRSEEHIAKEGFGLGLSLAEKIVKLHRGHIKATSSPGYGSSFTIILPVTTTTAS